MEQVKTINVGQVWRGLESYSYVGYYLAQYENLAGDAIYMQKIENDGTLGAFGFYTKYHFFKSDGLSLEFAYDSMEDYLKDFLKVSNYSASGLSEKCIVLQEKCYEMTKALESLEDEWSACEKQLAEYTKGKKSFMAHGHLFVLEPDEESYQITKIETLC